MQRQTKIVCTIGPATSSEAALQALIEAGMNVARLNFAHGDHAQHGAVIARVRALAERLDAPVAVLQDLAGPKVRIGTVADGSKVNHLTYIGDASIGRNVNVGAGTITCNYDGANKYRTVIGDNAFIGSGVELVAPVEVGEGAVIGAGSTISKDAPPGQLTLERSRQVTVPGWKRPAKKSH